MELTIEELAQRAGVPVRTVRYYIAEGILPPAGSRGKSATYGAEHLTKLLLARLLADRRVLLADIRDQVSQLTSAEARELLQRERARDREVKKAERQSPRDFVSSLLDQARRPPVRPVTSHAPQLLAEADASRPAQATSPQTASSWRRLELAPGVELHVRSDVEASQATLIRRLLREAKEE